jgi:hypothetical protein
VRPQRLPNHKQMGITEYVSSSHTFGVLICAKNDDLCAAAARRIQRSTPQFYGLYTYNSISASEVDPLYAFVARQYRTVVWLRAGIDVIPVICATAPALVATLQRALQHYGTTTSRATCDSDADATIFAPHTILDSAETRNEFADYVATALQGVS